MASVDLPRVAYNSSWPTVAWNCKVSITWITLPFIEHGTDPMTLTEARRSLDVVRSIAAQQAPRPLDGLGKPPPEQNHRMPMCGVTIRRYGRLHAARAAR